MSKSVLDGTAWLSSVRVVKRNIQLFNERNPYHMSYFLLNVKDTSREVLPIQKVDGPGKHCEYRLIVDSAPL